MLCGDGGLEGAVTVPPTKAIIVRLWLTLGCCTVLVAAGAPSTVGVAGAIIAIAPGALAVVDELMRASESVPCVASSSVATSWSVASVAGAAGTGAVVVGAAVVDGAAATSFGTVASVSVVVPVGRSDRPTPTATSANTATSDDTVAVARRRRRPAWAAASRVAEAHITSGSVAVPADASRCSSRWMVGSGRSVMAFSDSG
jgi:hypothetical protein